MLICTFASSSVGNSTLISDGGTHILIDAGITIRRIKKCLTKFNLELESLSGVFITHEHSDHVKGLKVITKSYNLPVFASPAVADALENMIPESQNRVQRFNIGEDIELGALHIKSFKTMHDTLESVGYRISGIERAMAYITDLGCITDEVRNAVLGVDAAIIEANHDAGMINSGFNPENVKERILSKHGHLSNTESGCFATELAYAGAKKLMLAHLSRENNTPRIARGTVAAALEKCGFKIGEDVELRVAPADTMCCMTV